MNLEDKLTELRNEGADYAYVEGFEAGSDFDEHKKCGTCEKEQLCFIKFIVGIDDDSFYCSDWEQKI